MEPLKVLILEDVEIDVEFIKRMLKTRMDYAFLFKWVITEKDFKKAVKEFHPDIILSDYNLPQFTGLDALKIAREYNNLIPFIIVTGTLTEETAAECIQLGAWDYVVKDRLHRLPEAMEKAFILKKEKRKVRQAETELNLIKKQSGVQLKLLYQAINQAPVSLLITDASGIIQYVNPAFEEITGYKKEEVVGEKAQILQSENYDHSFLEKIRDEIKNKKVFRDEIISKRKNGDPYWEVISVSALKNEKGDIEHFIVISRDITESKKIQQAIIESENLYRAIFENTGTATMIIDADGFISLVNSKFEELSGISKKEVEGVYKWMQFVPEPDKSRMIEYQRRRQKKEKEVPTSYEFTFRRHDGELRRILLTVDLIPGTNQTIASLLDITRRKNMETELKASKEKYQNLVENINDVLFEIDLEGIITYISPIIENLTGYSDCYYTGKSFFDLIYPEDVEITKTKLNNLLSKNRMAPNEFRVKTRSGELIWIQTSANKIIKNGKTVGLRGLAVDISKQKKAEDALIRAKEMAEESDRLKSTFLATMSHELRTPLNAIIGFSEMLNGPVSPNEIKEMSRIINESGNKLLAIIEDIFAISLLKTKEPTIVREKFTLSEILVSLEQLVLFELQNQQKTEIAFKMVKPTGNPCFYTDKTKLIQLLTNLLKNAVKFTVRGSITLLVEIESTDVLFKVIDTGVGIPEDKKDIIFEQFRQVDDSSIRKYGGLGLGLAISKEIARILGGTLHVESTEGKGSIFSFTLKKTWVSDEITKG
jgi:PAS domain S-box-containing protein